MVSQLVSIREHVLSVIGDDKAGHEYERYSKTLMNAAIDYAVAFISNIDPPRFVRSVRHELVVGSIQTLPQDCVKLTNAVNVVDAAGNFVSTLSKGLAEDIQAFAGVGTCVPMQAGIAEYRPTVFALSGDDAQTFFISPAVPTAGQYFILLSCSVPSAEALCDPKFTNKWKSFYPAIVEYVLYTLMAGEDDVRVNDTSQMHFNNFLRLLGINKAIADQQKRELDTADA